jgi:hypothetical protein
LSSVKSWLPAITSFSGASRDLRREMACLNSSSFDSWVRSPQWIIRSTGGSWAVMGLVPWVSEIMRMRVGGGECMLGSSFVR